MNCDYLYDDLERRASLSMDRSAFDYYAGGSSSDQTRPETNAAWGSFSLVPKTLRGAGRGRDTSTILGVERPSPLMIAPMAMSSLLHAEAEVGIAQAARVAGVSYTVSFRSSIRPSIVAGAFHDPGATDALMAKLPHAHRNMLESFGDTAAPTLWYQVYVVEEQSIMDACIDDAVMGGVEGLVVTVDTPYLGLRVRDLRNGYAPVSLDVPAEVLGATFRARYSDDEWKTALTQRFDLREDDLAQLVNNAKVPVIAKGILRGEEVSQLRRVGVDGAWISNHGGRQLDGAVAPIDAIGAFDLELRRTSTLVLDGGVRLPRHVILGLCQGASMVGLGRQAAWAFHLGGSIGLACFLIEMRFEVRNLLGLCGVSKVAELDDSFIYRPAR